jgi:hypothetical protein
MGRLGKIGEIFDPVALKSCLGCVALPILSGASEHLSALPNVPLATSKDNGRIRRPAFLVSGIRLCGVLTSRLPLCVPSKKKLF